MRCPQITAVAWLMLLCAVAPAHAEKRVALVLGNGAYRHADRLANPVNDARAMRDALTKLGFDVTYGEDLDLKALRQRIGQFASRADNADVALVYFAGHGATFGDTSYIVPVDAEFANLDEVPYELVAVETLIGELRRAKGVRIAILDACRDNGAERELKRQAARGGAVTRGLAPMKNPSGLIIAYATQYLETAADDAGGAGRGGLFSWGNSSTKHSPFTAALLNNIATPGIDVTEMFRKVGRDVAAATGGKQRPEISISMYEQYALAPVGAAPVVAAPPSGGSAAGSDAAQAWGIIQNTTSLAVLDEYIRQFGNAPIYGAIARARREELEKQQAEKPAEPAGGQQTAAAATPVTPAVPAPTPLTAAREAALAASPRIPLDNPRIKGSVSLLGGRIDDLSLVRSDDAANPSASILLSPANGPNAFYAEFGWLAGSGLKIKLPDSNTTWKQDDSGRLDPVHPVVLTYDNRAGLKFRRTISIDDKYVFNIADEVTNEGAAAVTLFPHVLLSRFGMPDAQENLRLVGDLGNHGLQELTPKAITEKKSVTFDVTGGWLGMASQLWSVWLLPGEAVHLKARFSAIAVGDTPIYQADYLLDALTVAPGETARATAVLFAGARNPQIIFSYLKALAPGLRWVE